MSCCYFFSLTVKTFCYWSMTVTSWSFSLNGAKRCVLLATLGCHYPTRLPLTNEGAWVKWNPCSQAREVESWWLKCYVFCFVSWQVYFQNLSFNSALVNLMFPPLYATSLPHIPTWETSRSRPIWESGSCTFSLVKRLTLFAHYETTRNQRCKQVISSSR